MTIDALMRFLGHGLLATMISVQGVYAAAVHPALSPPGIYHTSWIGNSFSGNGATSANANGFGYWVQDNATSMAVSPDGTVFLGTGWDEAQRTVGLYKNGQPNRILVRADSAKRTWGFNTANTGLCVSGSYFYVASAAKELLRFRWTPGDINSARYVDETVIPQKAVSLSCSDSKIVVAYPDEIEIRDITSLQPLASFQGTNLAFALPAPDGSFWTISDGKVQHLDAQGKGIGGALNGIGNPTSLAWGQHGQLVVTDNGPAQQVLFFDVSGQPKLASTFGVKGGLYAGTPGAIAPQKLFALVGAGVDAEGNLYVGMSFSQVPTGNTYLRAFSPSGDLLWQDYSAAFVDTFGFEPGSDGTVVFGRTTRWKLNLDNRTPGSEAMLEAVTLDPLHYPDDPRIKTGFSVYPRLIDGKQLLYITGQWASGYRIFAQSPGSEIFHLVERTPFKGWAWQVTDNGDIWSADAANRQIAFYKLISVNPDGMPVYNWNQPQTWPWPADFKEISRVIYDKRTDSLYLFGYLDTQRADTWGMLGFTARRYDGWMAGKPTLKWSNSSLPVSPNGLGFGKPQSPKDVALAGNYLFFGMARSFRQQSTVNILDANNGQLVGALRAGPEVGNVGGDEDIIGSVQATQTAQGEYLVLVEDDWRGKNLLFRWKP